MPWMIFETELGPCGVAWNDAGLVWLQLPESDADATRARLLSKARAPGSMASPRTTPGWVKDAITRVRAHLGGRAQDLSRVPLDLAHATALTTRIYRALQAVPPGRTVTYGELAGLAGSPGAARAVGRAMATNPFPIVVPCHRVVASGGGAGGFSAWGGLLTKEKLLVLEGGSLSKQQSLFGDPKTARPARSGLPFDGDAALRHLTDADALLAKHIARIGPLRLEIARSESTFAALAESIVYQQLNGKAAATIFGRLCALFPRGRLDPAALLATKEEALRGAGLSRGKLASLRDLATKTVAGEIPSLRELETLDDETIVERLTPVRGIGRWTVEMLLIFRLGRPDVLPVADYGIKKGFARIFPNGRTKYADGELPPPEVLVKRAERWRPYRSVASWYLWRATDS